MIELTEQQVQALADADEVPPTVMDRKTKTTYVLVRKDLFDRLAYDASPWSDEEMEVLAWEVGASAGWEDMDDYDHYEKKP